MFLLHLGSGAVVVSDSVTASLKSSLVHEFIKASIIIEEEATITDKINLRSNSKIEATSSLGVSFAIEHTYMTGVNSEDISADNMFKGMFHVGPMYIKTTSAQSFAIIPFRPEAKIDSNIEFDSTVARVQTAISATLANGELSVLSNTKAFGDSLTHVAELSFKDRKVSLTCGANALVLGVKLQKQVEASADASGATAKVETNVELYDNRGYSLLTASLDGNGLAVNNNAMLKLLGSQLTHKASLKCNKNGLTTSGLTSLHSLVSLENTFDAAVDLSKVTLSITNNAALVGVNINNANTLTVTPSTLDFKTKAHATGSKYTSYSHDITLGLKPYSASANINNNLKLGSANFINEAKLEAELLKLDAMGSLKATYGHEDIQHTYKIKYADMTANAKFSTIGKVLGGYVNHNTELDVYGLAAIVTNDVRFISQPVRFDHSVRGSIVPLDINFDALFNANADIVMYGKHNGQLYAKYNLKAQPLAVVSVHECRASVTSTLDGDLSLETTFDTKAGIVLSPQEQQTKYTMASKMNEHAFNQGLTLYNTAERTGIEATGTVFTNVFNPDSPENQEFTLSAFFKYDKSTDSHVIQVPLLENLPVLLESIKGSVVQRAEALHDYVTSYEWGAAFDELHKFVVHFISEIHLRNSVNQLKQRFSDFMQESVSLEDLEVCLRKLEGTVEGWLHDLRFTVGYLVLYIYETMPMKTFIREAEQQLGALLRKYHIPQVILNTIAMITPCIKEMLELIPEEMRRDPVEYIIVVAKDLDVPNRLNMLHAKIKELIVKLEADKMIQGFLEKLGEFFHRLRIEETIQAVLQKVKDANIPLQLTRMYEFLIDMLKSIDFQHTIQQLNIIIETINDISKSLTYNNFVGFSNAVIDTFKEELIRMIRFLKIPPKLEATKDFVKFIISSSGRFVEHLREVKIAEIMKSVQDIFDEGIVNNVKTWAKFIKQKITNANLKVVINKYLNIIRKCYVSIITIISEKCMHTVELIRNVAPDLNIISDIQQIIGGLSKELMKAELTVPSVSIPFTDLVLPSVVFRMDDLDIPTQLDIPEFTILGTYTVEATTISLDDIKQRIAELLDFIISLEIPVVDADALFGDLTLNFLPSVNKISFPEITFPEISFPTIPKVPVEKFVNSLQLSEVKLPTIPTEISVPSFGKLYGEVKLLTPMYTMETSGELQNPTKNKMTPHFTGFLNSYAASKYFEILNYEFNSTARIAIPKLSRIVLAETVKFNHVALGIDHQASLSLYGRSAQAQAKTDVKVKTTPYTAKIASTAFIAIGGGMSASVNTAYNHLLDLSWIDMKSEVSVSQKSVAVQDGSSVILTVDNSCEGKINDDDSNHKSKLQMSITPSTVDLTFSGDTDTLGLKMKQQIKAESGTFSYFKFNVRNEAETAVFKNSLLVASGQGNIYDMKVELKANHGTEVQGEGKGFISNTFNLVARPFEFVYEFHNKGSVTLGTPHANIDLQNDYSIILRPDTQLIATVALARLDQYKTFYNFTFINNEQEAGVFSAMENTGILDILTFAVRDPEIDFYELKLYELPALKTLLATTEQPLAVDAKLVFQKAQPFAEIMGLVPVPHVANMIAELSVKSGFINLNANAGLYPKDNLVFRLGATAASVFESLNAKLQGTTSLTTKRGLKLANSLSFENPHIEGSHNSSIIASSETFETTVSVANTAKISLPIFTLETKQNLVANTRNKPNVVSTFTVKGDFDLPVIEAVGKAEADHNMKLEGTLEYVSLESTTRANMDGTINADYLVLGVLDNEVNAYLNNDGLRSTSKIIADAKVNHGTTRVISLDVNENVAVEGSPRHVYAVLTYTSNNEAKLFDFHTKGKHVAKATVDVTPSSLTANVDVDVAQPSTMGDVSISEKTAAEATVLKQKMSTAATFSSPLYTTNLEADFDGQVPVFKVTFTSSGTLDKELPEFDIKGRLVKFTEHNDLFNTEITLLFLPLASTTANYENEAVNVISKVVLTVADLSMNVNHTITKALR